MIKAAPKVAIVVVNYRTAADTLRCVRSLLQMDYPNFEIIVVDNDSGDGSAERLRRELPAETRFVVAERNGGYTTGNNLGIRLALEHGAEYVHLLNPDTVVIDRTYLRRLVHHMAEHPAVGACGPRVHLRQVGCVQNTVLRFPWIWRTLTDWPRDRLVGPTCRSGVSHCRAEALNGVCVLLRRECLEQVGLFDEAIFAYVEDVEFAARCRWAGWHLDYVPVHSVLHLQKESGYELDSAVSYLLKRNTAYFLLRTGHSVQAVLFMLLSLILSFLRACVRLALARLPSAWRFLRLSIVLAHSYSRLLWPQTRAMAMGPPPAWLRLHCATQHRSPTRKRGSSMHSASLARRATVRCAVTEIPGSCTMQVSEVPGPRYDAVRGGRTKVCIVTLVPAPYREPLFARLARLPDVDLKVFYFAVTLGEVAWRPGDTRNENAGYPCEVLPNWTPRRLRFLPLVGFVNWSILRRLKDERPDYVVVYGYNFVTHLLAIAYCWWSKTPYALRSDSNGFVERRAGWKHRLKRRLLGPIVRRAHALLCVGAANRHYWEIYGANSWQLKEAGYAVDNDWLNSEWARHAADAAELRTELAWTKRCVFLFTGRLVPEKGVDALVNAMNCLCSSRDDVALAVVGSGRLRESLLKRLAPNALRCVRFFGQVSYRQIPRYFAMADVLVLPSRHESWGLVINEAMACGIPVIATECCGAAHDLLMPGRTGLRIERPSAEGLAAAMGWMADHPAERIAMGTAARELLREWTFDRTLRGFCSAIREATGRGCGDAVAFCSRAA